MQNYESVASLVWGRFRNEGEPFQIHSIGDGAPLAAGRLFASFDELWRSDLPGNLDFLSIGTALAEQLLGQRSEWAAVIHRETGFDLIDCEEMVEGAVAYARGFAAHPSTQLRAPVAPVMVSDGRRMELVGVPYGTVAAILPHNAFLPLALACLLNALRAGNRVVLRSPTQSAGSAALLSEAVARIPALSPWVSIVVCSARPFVESFMAAPGSGLLHFFGSSRRAAELLGNGFDAGKTVLVDGEGNGWVYVDPRFSPEAAAETIAGGAFRYHGQTCTSINGAVVHPDLFEAVANRVTERARAQSEGRPLFDEAQAAWCVERVAESGGEVVAGGTCVGAAMAPTVVLRPRPDSALVREGLFGPAVWLAPGDASVFTQRWASNRFPLCAGVLQSPADPGVWAARLPGLARLVLNGDPSAEDPFEYWGGYPPSGQNPVSAWPDKYRRVVQIDRPE